MHETDPLAAAREESFPATPGLNSSSVLVQTNIDQQHPSNTSLENSTFSAFVQSGNPKETLEHLLVIILAYVVVCLAFYRAIFSRYGRNSKLLQRSRFPNAKRVLLVTAHPDDESMFFGPTILSLIRRKDCNLYLLCLSKGEFWKTHKIKR